MGKQLAYVITENGIAGITTAEILIFSTRVP